ncbi:MAG TPA: hypothetical protein VF585_04080 [Chthoniobacterales bacterium]|jgi:hypothetical protein
MDLFEAKSDRGLERRVDESDLRNLYRAGFLHLDSLVRRSGSPNWFRVDEMFPHFSRIPAGKKYSATFEPAKRGSGLRVGLFVIVLIVLAAIFLLRFSQKLSAPKGSGGAAASQIGS